MTAHQQVSKAEVFAQIDRVKEKNYHHGVIGIAGQPTWNGSKAFTYQNETVRVCPVVSSLDTRARLLERDEVTWLVVLTDLSNDDLGFGIRSHLIGNRIHHTDPWRAIGSRFKATSTEHSLVRRAREAGQTYLGSLLHVIQAEQALPAAPAGMLTKDLLFGTLASRKLGLPNAENLTVDNVLIWSADESSKPGVDALKAELGAALSQDVLDWVAARCGVVEPAARTYLHAGQPQELLPLGLIASAIAQANPKHAPWTHLRMQTKATFSAAQLDAWSNIATRCFATVMSTSARVAERVLRYAEDLLKDYEAVDHAAVSDILDSGYVLRLQAYTRALGRIVDTEAGRTLNGQDLQNCETALERLAAHQRANDSTHHDSTEAAQASMRLIRWLALPQPEWNTLASAAARYRAEVAWVDRALNIVWTGSNDAAFSTKLELLAQRVHSIRARLDTRFAKLLADATSATPSVRGIERIIADTVVPIARKKPVSLIVVDGMGVTSATCVLDSIEARMPALSPLRADHQQPMALAVMPSLTTHSRTSLFAGHIASGGQAEELAGFSQQMHSNGLKGRLFHKKELESSTAGARISGAVESAVKNTDDVNVFACVLNSIDDALAKADPMGTNWDLNNVAHLSSILTESHRAGRTIILISDHGHIVDRRIGDKRGVERSTSARSRGTVPGAGDGEILVSGERVAGGSAVLAVDEALRYRARAAGYHGGASLAEMIIPIVVLDSDPSAIAELGWAPAPPEAPLWWREALGRTRTTTSTQESNPSARVKTKKAAKDSSAGTLFDIPSAVLEDPARAPASDSPPTPGALLAQSATFSRMRKSVLEDHLRTEALLNLINTLADAPQQAITEESAASILRVSRTRFSGAFSLVMRILNVEQYPVIGRDIPAGKVTLDVGLLQDQFDISWEAPA